MKPLLVFLLLQAYSGRILAERRRVSFRSCPFTRTNSDVLTTKRARSRIECSVICLNDPECLSASYCKIPGGYTCQLSGFYTEGYCSRSPTTADCGQTAIINPCENGAVFYPQNRTCHCVGGFVGAYCQRRYRDCTETPGGNADYLMQPLGSDCVFKWKCYAEASRRMHALKVNDMHTYNFKVSWKQIKIGTPNYVPDFHFMGLEKLHQLTEQGRYDMYALVLVHDVNYGRVWYNNFRVDSEEEGYAWHWDNSRESKNGEYLDGFGGAGDAAKNLNGARFGTYDNDVNGSASTGNASGWFNPAGCSRVVFESNGILWPTNRSGVVELELMDYVDVKLTNVYWYVEDDLVLCPYCIVRIEFFASFLCQDYSMYICLHYRIPGNNTGP